MKEKIMALEKVNDARPPQGRIHYSASVSALKPDDELVQAALAVLSNLMMVTNATSAEFEIGNPIDGVFKFTATHHKPSAPVCPRCGDLCACRRCHGCGVREGFEHLPSCSKPSEGKDDATG